MTDAIPTRSFRTNRTEHPPSALPERQTSGAIGSVTGASASSLSMAAGRVSSAPHTSSASFEAQQFQRSSNQWEDKRSQLLRQPSKRRTNSLEGMTINKLNFSKVDLMGRDQEVEALLDSFNKASSDYDSKKQLFLISGYSGVGKTRLARSLYPTVKKEGHLYVEGKFDQNCGNSKPYSAFSNMCGMVCAKILAMEDADDICSAIAKALGLETKLLLAAFPVLEEILQNREFQATEPRNPNTAGSQRSDQQAQEQQKPEEAKFRLNYAFCRFLRVLGNYFSLALVLDDLQWADVPSFDLLQDIVSDRQSSKLMIVGIYRSNEVDDTHLLTRVLREVRKKSENDNNNFDLEELEVGNLDIDAITSFLQDLLGTTLETVEQLATLCHKKTHGNVFFLIHFLQYIYGKEILEYNFGSLKWQWNEEGIEHDTMASDNVVDFVLSKMKDLGSNQHDILRLAACLGASFQEEHMRILWDQLGTKRQATSTSNVSPVEMTEALDSCVIDGYLYESSKSEVGFSEYFFVHDRVQEASALLTRHDEKIDFHKWVGETLLGALSSEQLGPILFSVVNLLNESDLPTQSLKRVQLAQLNYQACASALKGSAFQAVARHAAIGLELLGEEIFTEQASLALGLFSAGAVAESYLGNIETMENYCQSVMKQTTIPIEDKLQIYSTWLDSLANRGHFLKAVEVTLQLFGQFNTHFPSNRIIQKLCTWKEMIKTKRAIKRGLLQKIPKLPLQDDPMRSQLVHLMDRLSVYLFYTNDPLMALVMFRNLKWTLQYGLNDRSPVALTTMGMVLTGMMGNLKEGSACSQAAIDLIPRVSRLVEGRILLVAHCFGTTWTSPLREHLTPLQEAIKASLCAGDKESAGWSIYIFIVLRFLTSFSLDLIIEDIRSYLPEMLELNQIVSHRSLIPHYQMYANLAGITSTDPLSLTGENLTDKDHNEWMENTYYETQCRHWQSYINCIYGEHEECAKLALVNGTHLALKSDPGAFVFCYMEVFSKGISLSVAARTSPDRRRRKNYRKQVQEIYNRVGDWIVQGNPNVFHLNTYFDAEVAAYKGQRALASETFQTAIKIAARGGLLMDAGIFSEVYAEYVLTKGDKENARYNLKRALRYFRDFGAMRKVAMLEEKHGDLLSLQSTWLIMEDAK